MKKEEIFLKVQKMGLLLLFFKLADSLDQDNLDLFLNFQTLDYNRNHTLNYSLLYLHILKNKVCFSKEYKLNMNNLI